MTDREIFGEHVTPEELGAYLDRTLRSEAASRVEHHLAECAECRREAIDIGRLLRPREGTRGLKHAYWIAPAAAAAIAGLFLLGPGAGDVGDDGPTLRSDDTEVAITSLTPAVSSRLAADSVIFAWHQVDNDVVYQVTLLDEGGAVLWNGTTADTSIALPTDISLTPGSRFFWYVDALLDEARSVSSGVQEFFTLP